MLEPDLIELFVGPLQTAGIRYFISGSVAAMLYGEPRVTHDIDLVVFLRAADIAKLPQLFPAPEFYVPPAEVIAAEMGRQQHGCFNVIHADSSLKADFFTANRDEFHAWAFRNVKTYSARGMMVTLAPPEYVIVRKLEYFRNAARRNICATFAASSTFPERKSTRPTCRSGFNEAASSRNGGKSATTKHKAYALPKILDDGAGE